MIANTQNLTRKQEQVIAVLLSARNVNEAAKVSGINAATIYRWLKQPCFVDAYREARRGIISQATTILSQAVVEAVEVLRSVMKDEHAPAASRVTAARAVLEQATKMLELEDIDSKIEQLEASLDQILTRIGGEDGHVPLDSYSSTGRVSPASSKLSSAHARSFSTLLSGRGQVCSRGDIGSQHRGGLDRPSPYPKGGEYPGNVR